MNRLYGKILIKNKSLLVMFTASILFIFTKVLFLIFKDVSFDNYPLAEIVRALYNNILVYYSLIAIITIIISDKIKSLMGETLQISHKKDVYKSIFCFVGLVCITVMSVVMFIQVILFLIYGKGNNQYLFRITIDAFFFYGMVGIIGFLSGTIISQIKNEIMKFSVLAMVVFLLSDYGLMVTASNTYLYRVRKMLQIMPLDSHYAFDYSTGRHLGIWQGCLIVGWLFVLLAKNGLGKVHFVYPVSFMLIGFVVLILAVIYKVEPRQDILSENDKTIYSEVEYADISNKEMCVSAPFYVIQYDFDISIYDKLKVSVNMKLNKSDCEEYTFTLLHSYKMIEVNDNQGANLSYERKGDTITVKGTGNLPEISMTYEGKSSIYYSDLESTMLLAGSPWYPYPGRQVFYGVIPDENGLEYEAERRVFNNLALYNVSINSPYKIYANLSESSKNRYSGETDTLMLVGGYGYIKKIKDNITYVYMQELEYSPKLPNGIGSWFDVIEKEMTEENLLFEGEVYVFQGAQKRTTLNADFGRMLVGSNLVMYNLDGVYRK